MFKLRGEGWKTLSAGTLMITIKPVPLSASGRSVTSVIVQNDPDGRESVFVGDKGSQDFQLAIGASVTIPIDDLAKVYVRSSGGVAWVNWLAGV